MGALVVDAFDFCRRGEERAGKEAVRALIRLSAELAESTGYLDWSVRGAIDKLGHARLYLSVRAPVNLVCQRCLKPVAFEIDSQSVLVLAEDEEVADQMEALLEDEDVDVIVGSAAQNLLVLIEDDALLALPLAPHHEICPAPLTASEIGEKKAESPFAVLQKLKDK